MSAFSPPGESKALDEHIHCNVPDALASPPGRGSPAPSSLVTPLRIAKRASPQPSRSRIESIQLARRTSSSYKHVKNNNLVSKSPFKSQIPTPTRPSSIPSAPIPRRTSGEKRPRPLSMSEQAESDDPQPYKRRQSRGFQGLIEREPVTKSPFKQRTERSTTPEAPPVPDKLSIDAPNAPAVSPRSALVSRRLHGPRSHDGHNPLGSRRQRRKTVTFNECCDVVEFDQESIELRDEDPFESDDGEDDYDEDDIFINNIELDEGQLTTLDSGDTINVTQSQGDYERTDFETPASTSPLPPDMEAEDGAPYGRSHHHDRLVADHPHPVLEEPPSPPLPHVDSPRLEAITPEKYRQHVSPSPAQPASDEEARRDIADPSIKEESVAIELSFLSNDSLDPANLSIGHTEVSLSGLEEELGLRQDHEVRQPSLDLAPVAPLRLSASPSPRPALSMPPRTASPGAQAWEGPVFAPRASNSSAPPSPLGRRGSPSLGRVGSPLGYFSGSGNGKSSPYQRLGTDELGDSLTGSGRRSPRISRDDVQRRLATKRSMESPLREVPPERSAVLQEEEPHEEEVWIKETSSGFIDPRDIEQADMTLDDFIDEKGKKPSVEEQGKRGLPLNRLDNPTYDGVMSIDPNPQPIDPPRPQLHKRAHTLADGEVDFERELTRSRLSMAGMRLSEVSALDRLMEDVVGEQVGAGMRVEDVTEGVIAGQYDVSGDTTQEAETMTADSRSRPVLDHANTEPVLLSTSQFAGSVPVSRSVSDSSIPPAVPPKDAIRSREEMIIEKRREARRREHGDDFLSPSTSGLGYGLPSTANRAGRPSRRRSMSTGDAEDILTQRRVSAMRDSKLLDMSLEGEDDALAESIDRELRKRGNAPVRYRVREHEGTIYASADADHVRHMESAGDLNGGNAWRTVRRPSDMNEHAKQIKEYQAHNTGKARGKLFVKVVGVSGLRVPMPQEPTFMTCTLNNGIHFVTTPECRLAPECVIGQEFELVEHSSLEFTLTLRIRRDQHIVSMFKALASPPPQPQPPPPPPASKGGFRHMFSSPKKAAKAQQQQQPPPPPEPRQIAIKENLARYLNPDGVLARAMVRFEDVVGHCDVKLFESDFPLIGQRLEAGMTMASVNIGFIRLQMFRFPALPGVPGRELPQSLEECDSGLRNIIWHKTTYFEGTLTQSGGDCITWRRRRFRIVGANLVAYNDVTKRATATIDLKKAVGVRDDEDARTASARRYSDDLLGMERSFRLLFPGDQEIVFFADTDEEKARWLDILHAITGHIPPYPLWAELLWQRQSKRADHLARPTSALGLDSSQRRP